MHERILRYVELDALGEPIHECLHSHFGGPSEDESFGLLVASATKKGHTIVRLCGHADDCRNPDILQIEGDGNGGIRAKAEFENALNGVELWEQG
jgi:hypothetical protein